MSGTLLGVITGIDRANRVVHAALDDGQQIDATYLGGTPPWPLSVCMFTNEPASLCLGPLGDRRQVFHDDFMWGFAAATNRWDADGNWHGSTSDPSATIADQDDPGAGQAGAVRINGTAFGTATLRKLHSAITPPEDGQALWMTVRARLNAGMISGGQFNIGLVTSTWPSDHGLVLRKGSVVTGSWAFESFGVGGASSTEIDTGVAFDAAGWVWLDIMVVAGVWVAVWTDGSGPWTITTDVPVSGSSGLTPQFDATGPGAVDLDLVSLALVGPVHDPTNFALAPTSIAHW